jgi:ribose transport system substrate-binding protein
MVRPAAATIAGCCLGVVLGLIPIDRAVPSLPMIAFIPRTSGTNFAEDMHHGALEAARSKGFQIYWNAPTREDDLDRQILIAENAFHKGAKALILGPTNVWGVTSMIDRLEGRRIPVVMVQTEAPMPAGPYLTSITPDQAEFGRLAAARIASVIGGAGEVAIVGLDRGTPETLARAQSFMKAIAAHPAIQVDIQSQGSVQIPEAVQNTREILHSFPRLKAIYALSADATQGAMLSLEDAGAGRGIALVGSDRDLFLMNDLHDGKLDSLVVADPYQIGYLAVIAAIAGVQGKPLQPPARVAVTLLTRQDLVAVGH